MKSASLPSPSTPTSITYCLILHTIHSSFGITREAFQLASTMLSPGSVKRESSSKNCTPIWRALLSFFHAFPTTCRLYLLHLGNHVPNLQFTVRELEDELGSWWTAGSHHSSLQVLGRCGWQSDAQSLSQLMTSPFSIIIPIIRKLEGQKVFTVNLPPPKER